MTLTKLSGGKSGLSLGTYKAQTHYLENYPLSLLHFFYVFSISYLFICYILRRCIGGNDTHKAVGWNVRPLHGEGDTVERDEEQHGVVELLLVRQPFAQVTRPARSKGQRSVVKGQRSRVNLCIINGTQSDQRLTEGS